MENKTRVVHCMKTPDYDIYIGRPSPWGNPWSHLAKTCAEFKTATRDEAIENYRKWLNGKAFQDVKPEYRAWILSNLTTIKGKTIACWCSPQPCHGDVLAELADNLEEDIANDS